MSVSLFSGVAGTGALAAIPSAATGATGAVYLSTLPGGADVWIDGTYVGRSPVLVDALVAGRHVVTVTKSGWNVQEIDLSIDAGTVLMKSLQLARSAKSASSSRGVFSVRGLPPGAAIAVDGVPVGADAAQHGALPLAAGTHQLVIHTPQGKVSRHFTVFPDTATEIIASGGIAEAPSDEAKSVVVAPADAYLPDDAYSVDHGRISLRYAGHAVVAHLGELAVRYDGVPMSFDVAPSLIGGKLYLPLELLTRITGLTPTPSGSAKAK